MDERFFKQKTPVIYESMVRFHSFNDKQITHRKSVKWHTSLTTMKSLKVAAVL